MKKLLIVSIVILFTLSSCKKDEPTPAKSLVGTRWSSFNYKSVVDNSNVYKILYFKNETEIEYYSASEKTKIIGSKEIITYTYSHPTLTVVRKNTVNSNGDFTIVGTVSDTFINIFSADYSKE
ncbi:MULTISPECIES: hypothetical protein [unclassified Arcicella]|uniref:hypothetical protein n=1 Tax=unclassified Arcicella TaxID=2644986 RepID=UPI00285570EA|nr:MULTISPECIES: hypothetical protein [unclassified Arcicella]MDR6565019.1 hypothetical protein [Arcicella sp. BE51]MDR6814832.1 hypothetical protein [Arcicella sp. BE140]MDR6826280.1 hypothetical protein [Arcicella sp. BE139]